MWEFILNKDIIPCQEYVHQPNINGNSMVLQSSKEYLYTSQPIFSRISCGKFKQRSEKWWNYDFLESRGLEIDTSKEMHSLILWYSNAQWSCVFTDRALLCCPHNLPATFSLFFAVPLFSILQDTERKKNSHREGACSLLKAIRKEGDILFNDSKTHLIFLYYTVPKKSLCHIEQKFGSISPNPLFIYLCFAPIVRSIIPVIASFCSLLLGGVAFNLELSLWRWADPERNLVNLVMLCHISKS